MTLIYLSCAWVTGIFLGSKFDLPVLLMLTGLVPFSLFPLCRYRGTAVLLGLCLIVLFGSAAYYQSNLRQINEKSLDFYNNRVVTVKGVISNDPDVTEKTIHLNLSAQEIGINNNWHPVYGTALLFVPIYSTYKYGDILLVTGKLETPPQFDDFDYKNYLAHQGIYSTMLYPGIEILERGRGSKFFEWIYSLRNRLSQILAEILPEPQASLAQGIILGKRGNIPAPVTENFAMTGTSHLLAISGLHITIMAGIMLSFGIWLFGRRHYIYVWLTLTIIWLYAMLTGMNPPVVRAAIMASLFLIAELLGRQRSGITALSFAAAIMIGVSPQIMWTASFQLSFLSMTGLILLTPSLLNLGRNLISSSFDESNSMVVRPAKFTTDSLSVTIGTMIAVFPVIVYYFGIISFVAPLANLITIPALPGAIIAGTLASLVGLFALPVAQFIGWLAWLFLSYILAVVNGFASLPFSSINVENFSAKFIFTYYVVLTAGIWLYSHRSKLSRMMSETASRLKSGINQPSLISRLPAKWIVPSLSMIAVLTSLTAVTIPDNNLHVSFLNVGQGDAILLQKGNQQILVDGGPSAQKICVELGQKMPFWDRTIDLVVLTHPDSDHFAGLIEVLKRYRVEQVLYSDLTSQSPLYTEWLKLIEQKGIESIQASANQQIDVDEVKIEVLNPPSPISSDAESDIDDNSIVLWVDTGKISFLLTGDIRQDKETELISQRAIPTSTVLKVAHHGSNTSTCEEFLNTASPQIAVISVGEENRFSHPNKELMERLEEKLGAENIYRTDKHGTIEFITDGKRLWVKKER